MDVFAQTPERKEIMETLAQAEGLLHRRAEAYRKLRSEERTNRALNRATVVRCLMDLLTHDWHEDDEADGQARESHQ